MRYSFITRITRNNVIKPKESIEQLRSNKIDKILTGKYTAIPIFIIIMFSVFFLTFEVIGPIFENIISLLINSLCGIVSHWMINSNVNKILQSLIIDGIFKGVGSLLSFMPIIVILFFFLSILEDSGYMARVAFFMDKLLRRIGLSGRSIVPMLIGFGCSVPGVMSARTLPSEKDRKMTILLIPFMSCSAKLPIYAFFSKLFFPAYSGLIMTGLYIFGIIIGITIAHVFKATLFKGEAVPFVMELPSYRLPNIKNVGQLMWEKAKDYLQRAFSIILIASIIIWFLQSFSFNLSFVSSSKESILANISNLITPIFKPCGFEDYRITVALISGFLAKEAVVSSLGVLMSNSELLSLLNTASCLSLLVFCLLYVPCIATISAIKQEMGSKWAIFVVIFQCVVAWILSIITYLIISSIILV